MGDARRCLQGFLPEAIEQKYRREDDDGRKKEGTEVCARTCVPRTDARIHGRSRCADREGEEIDGSNQIHE